MSGQSRKDMDMQQAERLGIALAGLSLAQIDIRSILEAYSGIPDHVRRELEKAAATIDERYSRAKYYS